MDAGIRTSLRIRKENRIHGIFPSLLLGFTVAAVFSLAFLAASSIFACEAEDPSALLFPLAAVSLALSSLVCGFASSRYAGKNGLAVGLLAGCVFACFLFLASLILSIPIDGPFWKVLAVYGSVIFLSGIGGLLSRRKTRNYRRLPFPET